MKMIDIRYLVNKYLIGAHRHYHVYLVNEETGRHYQAEFHRSRYWYDGEKITLKGIFEKRRSWHVWYWDCFDGKGGRVMIWTTFPLLPIVNGSLRKVEKIITEELKRAVESREKLIDKTNESQPKVDI